MAKTCKLIAKAMICEVFASCVRERKRYCIINKTSKMRPNSIPKSMKSLCNIRAGRSEMMEHGWKMEAKLEPTLTECKKERDPKSMLKKHVRPDMPGGSAA